MTGSVKVTALTRSCCFRVVAVVVIARVGHSVQCAEELLVRFVSLVRSVLLRLPCVSSIRDVVFNDVLQVCHPPKSTEMQQSRISEHLRTGNTPQIVAPTCSTRHAHPHCA